MDELLEEHINSVDAFTLTLERDPLLRATIVAVATFDRSPDWEVLTERVDRATRLIPRFREKLVRVPFGLAPPRWIVDPDFELGLHLRRVRVRRNGGTEAVLDYARIAAMMAFDRDRPLWEFTLLEGLPEGKAALVMKLHHALTDGVGGIEIASHVVDLQREPADLGPMPAAPVATDHGLVEMLGDTIGFHQRRAIDVGEGILRAIPRNALRAVTNPADTVAQTLDTAMAVARFVRPVAHTASPVMVGRRPLRHFGQLDVPLEPLRKAAHRVDSTINVAFLAAIGGGMRIYHERHLAAVDHLRASMPISVRSDDDQQGGNRITLERFDLPVGGSDPRQRMLDIDVICHELRDDPAIPLAGSIAGVLNLLPVDITAGMLKHVDLLVSNVPGFTEEVFAGGALVESFHPFGATLGSAVNITLMSYRGTCHVGVNTDAGAVLDPDNLLEDVKAGFEEVAAIAESDD